MSRIWARINNRNFEVNGGNWTVQLDDADTFSFTVLLADVPDYLELKYQDVAIVYQGNVLVSGQITNHRLKRSTREQTIEVEFDCTGELARLEGEKAAAGAHYQNSAVLAILATILPTDWTLQQVNMQDALIETTIDLRNKEKLMQQMVAIFNGIPNLHYRYGGRSGSDYILQVGNFDTLSEEYVEGVNANAIITDYTSHEVLRDIYPYGYLSSDAVITLTDLYSNPLTQTLNASIAARITAHPDFTAFPVLPDGTEFFMRNSAVTIQRSTRRQYRLIKTRNNVLPTADQKAEAAYALWLSTVADLKRSTLYKKLKVEALLNNAPSIADRAKLSGVVQEPVIDPLSSKVDYIPVFEVNEDYRIVGFSTKFELGELNGLEGIFFDVTCTDNDSAEEIDPELAMYRRMEQVGDYDDKSTALVLSPPLLASKSHTNADASDCSGGVGPIAGKIFTVTAPTPPVDATSVVTSVAIIPSTAVLFSETPPASPGDPWIGCVSDVGGTAWPPAAGVTITVVVSFLYT